MNGIDYVLDTNIILYVIGGMIEQNVLPDGVFSISFITELETLSYPSLSDDEKREITNFLDNISIIDIDKEIKGHTISLRKNYNIKLPDAIIAATAISQNAILITNDKQFLKISELKSQGLNLKLKESDSENS